MNKLFKISLLLCIGFFSLSYTISLSFKDNDYPFPKSILFEYAKSSELDMEEHKISFYDKNINSIELRTVSGDVRFEESEDEDIHIYVVGAKDQILSKTQGKTLELELKKDSKKHVYFNLGEKDDFIFSIGDAEIRIQIPERLKHLKVDSNSGDIRLRDIEPQFVEVNVTSGDISFYTDNVEEVDLKTVSGDIRVKASEGGPSRLKAYSTSGDIRVRSKSEEPLEIELQTVSGDKKIKKETRARLELQKNNSHLWKIETVSGDIRI